MSSATAIGIVGLVVLLLFSSSIAYGSQRILVSLSAAAIGVGLIAMIIHLNLGRGVSEEHKSRWRRMLMVTGPLAAVGYLWSVPNHAAQSGATAQANHWTLGVAALICIACSIGTYYLLNSLPDRSSIVSTGDLLIYRLLEAAAILSTIGACRIVNLRLVPMLVVITPAIVVLLAMSHEELAIRIMISGACVLIGLLVSMTLPPRHDAVGVTPAERK